MCETRKYPDANSRHTHAAAYKECKQTVRNKYDTGHVLILHAVHIGTVSPGYETAYGRATNRCGYTHFPAPADLTTINDPRDLFHMRALRGCFSWYDLLSVVQQISVVAVVVGCCRVHRFKVVAMLRLNGNTEETAPCRNGITVQ